ncbi:MAG: hypothetical protein K6F84_02615 [Lachnospiraceae bacterium]|nr:hypothetical protein [Lachnospiraceae bacterium]
MHLTIGDLSVSGHFVLANTDNEALIVGAFHRSKTKIKAVGAMIGSKVLKFGWKKYDTRGDDEWKCFFHTEQIGRETVTYILAISEKVGKQFLLTTKDMLLDDYYDFLMVNYCMPLKKEWTGQLMKILEDKRLVRESYLRKEKEPHNEINLKLHGKEVDIADLVAIDFSCLTEDALESVICESLRKKEIKMCDSPISPLNINGLDDYFTRYGKKAVDNLDKELSPLTALKPNVDNLALMEKSLFPQQAATVNGVLAMRDNGINYAVINHGMGCGKTLETISAIEAAKIGDWLKSNPGKTLKDAYMDKDIIHYRVAVMAPGHLLEKWKAEIESEIPYAKVDIVRHLSQLITLREERKNPKGKEFYIFSKDFCKLDTMYSPTPTHIRSRYVALDICADCYHDDHSINYKKGVGKNAECPVCHGSNFIPYELTYYGMKRGLVCPNCDGLLLRYKGLCPESSSFDDRIDSIILSPIDMASKCSTNEKCYHCDYPLWGANAKPLTTDDSKKILPKWRRVSHFANHRKKTKKTSWILNGKANEKAYKDAQVTVDGWSYVSQEYGPRKVAPARYIKKYLKGVFDFCILDECHKYLGESAQGTAAHALIKASKFTLCLTGTISNGTAGSFYNLFFMLEPKKLIDKGYKYSSSEMMRFCKTYGCVETVYEANYDILKNKFSRGKQLSPPKLMPGISPVLFGEVLIDRCLFMDISDLSKFLPKFHEEVKLVEVPNEVGHEYKRVLEILKQESKTNLGMSALSILLQFGLSYLDKPYGVKYIKDPYRKDSIVCNVEEFNEYETEMLLPKEEALIDIVNKEISQNRNLFIYASFTRSPDTNVVYRLKKIIEERCNLKGAVEIIQSSSPEASKREEWFHKKASEGIKVFITNPMNVETGLDFCFKYNGRFYNYPTLIFYQTSYSLATIWQASRRAFRLNQKCECRNYYLAYDGTLQAEALRIMAKKQVSTAAIQGHFSAEGLASMAKGVDARTELAAALSSGDMTSRDTLENMFDALQTSNETVDDSYSTFKKSLNFWELTGKQKYTGEVAFEDFLSKPAKDRIEEEKNSPDKTIMPDIKETESFEDFFAGIFNNLLFTSKPVKEEKEKPNIVPVKKAKPRKKEVVGQRSLFDMAF